MQKVLTVEEVEEFINNFRKLSADKQLIVIGLTKGLTMSNEIEASDAEV